MYKGKIKIWAILIIISLIISNFGIVTSGVGSFFKTTTSNIGTWIENNLGTTEYNTYVKIDEVSLTPKFHDYKKSGAKLHIVSNIDEAEVIIRNSSDEELEGYTKYSDWFSSPILMYVPSKAYSDDSGFIKNKTETTLSTYYYIQKDLKMILEALENDKKYSDIGLDEKIFNTEKVMIAIPNENAECFDEIKLLISLTLNNYNYEGINDVKLQKRVDNIISKCVKYESANQYLDKLIDEGRKAKKPIVLAPEYIVINSTSNYDSSNTGNTSTFVCCIPTKTINITYDIFVKDNKDNENYYDNLWESFTKKKFIDRIGLRNKEMDFDIRDRYGFGHTLNTIPIITD